ncbi:hypothetical protein [uncultured Chryseobacterium sp.]|uniref:hypothetical protein n=1 Tax=uncultured Chryseobacterium sp. TaxID=259322 RepID=UPI0025DC91C5|nr:hypothetical protein [uncultured Chryseobacterium sp.]
MKKMILLTGILIAEAVSANTISAKYESDGNSGNKKEVVSKDKNKTTLKNKATKRVQCATVVVTCTSAYTCQDWTADQWINWGQQIQNNYCMYDSPYTP